MKSTVCFILPRGKIDVSEELIASNFRGKNNKPSNKLAEASSNVLISCLANPSNLKMGRYVPPKRRAVSELHGITVQKTILFP
jgi:hypothetical protein